ncbi:hypothetical protein LTR33_018237, partial [Friedmanniomyces endolithicus]
ACWRLRHLALLQAARAPHWSTGCRRTNGGVLRHPSHTVQQTTGLRQGRGFEECGTGQRGVQAELWNAVRVERVRGVL